jgi:hypothetical protein
LRWTGRKGNPVRALVGACLAKSLYAIPTWSRTAALIAEHAVLRDALGAAPSVYALYRFATKLRRHRPLLDSCLDRIAAGLRRVRERKFQPETATLDKGYDVAQVYAACEAAGALPIIPLRQTPFVKRGDHRAPTCAHGTWTFAGADAKRGRTKWRCPSGECAPASTWIKADRLHPLVPRETKRWGDLYRGRGAVERAFGRLKHEHGLGPLRVRGIEKVALHADLCILATLARALARARAVPLAA